MKNILLTVFLSSFAFILLAQQNVFHRNDANTDNWWDNNNPWFYESWNNNQDRPDREWRTANNVFFGHNNNVNMNVNGSNDEWYFIKILTFQDTNNQTRTLTGTTDGAGIDLRGSAPRKIENLSSAEHVLDVRIALHDGVGEFNPINGNLAFKKEIFTNNNFIDVWGNNGHTLTIEGNIQGTGGLALKQNSIVLLIGNKTYTGDTFVEAGTLELQGSLASSGITVRSGATLRISNGNSKSNVIEINDLTVEPGGKVEIEPGAQLTVNGNLDIEEDSTKSIGELIIKSDDTGTGSLITNGTVSGNVAAERYIEQTSGWGSVHIAVDWHFLSSPVANQSISGDWTPEGEDGDYDFYAWDEAGTWLNQKADQNATIFDAFEPGKGYLVAYEETGTRTFTGALNNGDVTVSLQHSGNNNGKDWTYQPGWNLLGNPYQSAIDWSMVDHDPESSLFEDVYVYVYNRNRTVNDAPSPGYEEIYGGSANAFIPANQGFFVKAKDAAQFIFTNAMRTHGGSFMKDQPAQEKIVLHLYGNGYADETQIRFREDSKMERDPMDALKLFSLHPGVPQLFSKTADMIRVAINSIPQIDQELPITLGMRIPEDGEYTLTLQELSGAFGTSTLLLEDAHKDIFHDLHEQPVYAFEAEEGMISGRFTLHFSPLDEDDDTTDIPSADAQEARIWQHNNTLHVDNPDTDLYLHLYDINGRRLQNHHLAAGQHSIELNLPPSVYIIETSGKRHQETMKIIIQ